MQCRTYTRIENGHLKDVGSFQIELKIHRNFNKFYTKLENETLNLMLKSKYPKRKDNLKRFLFPDIRAHFQIWLHKTV